MIRRSTVVVVLIAIIVFASYVYLARKNEKQAEIDLTKTPEAQVGYLFNASEGVVASLRIESKTGETVEVARDATGAWMLIKPTEAKADDGMVEAASSQLTTIRVLSEIPGIDPDVVGLKIPEYVITVKFTSNVQRKAEIGVVTPTESGYYARDENEKIVIVSKDAVDALLNLLINPPYASPTETPPPATLEIVPIETATATPTP